MRDMLTYRHPRTMQEAFGPYTDRSIWEEVSPYRTVDKVLVVLCILVWVVVPLAMFMGWI